MPSPNTTSLLDIQTIRDGVALLNGGHLRATLHVSSLNFALKSTTEQEAIIYSYQDFLNSLDFSIQIYVNSRLVNIDGYLETLAQRTEQQTSTLLQMQTREYISFVQEFTKTANIIATDFFLVVPFHPVEARFQQGGAQTRLRTIASTAQGKEVIDDERFLHFRAQLLQRLDFVSSGLHRIGLSARMLTTEELLTLYWSLYNASDLKKRRLATALFRT